MCCPLLTVRSTSMYCPAGMVSSTDVSSRSAPPGIVTDVPSSESVPPNEPTSAVALFVSSLGQDRSLGEEPKIGRPSSLEEPSCGVGVRGPVGASLHEAPSTSSAPASTVPTLRRHPDCVRILILLARLLRESGLVFAKFLGLAKAIGKGQSTCRTQRNCWKRGEDMKVTVSSTGRSRTTSGPPRNRLIRRSSPKR